MDLELSLKYQNVSRFLTLLIILNSSVFIVTGLVQGYRYYFPLIAIAICLVEEILLMFPLIRLNSSRWLWALNISTLVSLYFTVASVVYYIQYGDLRGG